jgi:hypothetical protein
MNGSPPMDVRASYASNQGYTSESILRIRLDTQQLIQQTEYFLRGQLSRVVVDENTGRIREEVQQIGAPLANEKGVHAILAYLTATVNAQVVQGNYEWETWRLEVSWIREQLAIDLFVNHDDWNISPQSISLICNVVMNQIKPFLTRLVNNKERESYANFESREVHSGQQSRGLFGSIFGGK